MNIEEIEALNFMEYKKYQESFMQNNPGTWPTHVFFCIFFSVQCALYSSLALRNVTRPYLKYFLEYIIIVLPLTLAHTILVPYIYHLNLVIGVLVLLELQPYLVQLTKLRPMNKKKHLMSISLMRALTHLITAFAILGVDFQCFPRHLAKTEKYGYSLMDTGVGLYATMSGLVNKDLRSYKLSKILASNIRLIISLCFLGAMRYIFVKNLQYQEHVTEYGLHWNFFFTLAVCKLASIILLHFVTNTFEMSLLLLGIHELLMELFLRKWVFSDAERVNFLSANREGIASCLGYVSLYFFGVYLKELMSGQATHMLIRLFNSTYIYIHRIQIELSLMTILFWMLFAMVAAAFPASRTLANASYCLFIQSLVITIVTVLYFVENLVENEKQAFPMPYILTQINNHGFWYFLMANVITGILNLSIKTLAVPTGMSIVILNWYMIVTYGMIFGYIAILKWKPF